MRQYDNGLRVATGSGDPEATVGGTPRERPSMDGNTGKNSSAFWKVVACAALVLLGADELSDAIESVTESLS
jgi:hypothetical protein